METDVLHLIPDTEPENATTTGIPLIPPSSSTINTSALVDANSPTYWSYSVLGRRLLFRPIYRSGYRDAEDYYQKSYDDRAGLRVAVALGGLMLFICVIALNNRYGFFRKRRKLNVSVGNSQEELAGLEWLRLVGFQTQQQALRTGSVVEYNPACSDLDLLQSAARQLQLQRKHRPLARQSNHDVLVDGVQYQQQTEEGEELDPMTRLVASVEAMPVSWSSGPDHCNNEKTLLRCNSL
ncbi:hypothetical protein BV898_19286 [Hypsibius exemplaris]|uniref:Uncharacterized protein n=1 Tax=Hypsibius exemplaris TaxID=2072580 RepID=A0A9X6NRX4_HYPEX|nr:hypothetical protein BV898_19286 [Hypsibius exemplaris]